MATGAQLSITPESRRYAEMRTDESALAFYRSNAVALGRDFDVDPIAATMNRASTDMGNVSVTVQPLDLASVRAGAEAQGYAFEPVPGLGDAALYSDQVGLYVGKGNRTAIYLLAAGGMTDQKAKVIAWPSTQKSRRAAGPSRSVTSVTRILALPAMAKGSARKAMAESSSPASSSVKRKGAATA